MHLRCHIESQWAVNYRGKGKGKLDLLEESNDLPSNINFLEPRVIVADAWCLFQLGMIGQY
jgi:hypothetical protein